MGNLYSKTKIFHFKEKADSLPETVEKIEPPLHIRLKPTNVCAHNCWYCAYRADNIQLGQDMIKRDFIPKEKMRELVDDFAAMGVKSVTFSGGGDPFYYPFLPETVKWLAQAKIKFASLTNGARLRGEIASLFSQHGTWLRISLDGWDEASYAQYRGVGRDEFNKVMKNLEDFKKMEGDCLLGVSIIIDNKNAAHVSDLIRKLKGIGIDSVKLSPCIISNIGRENNEYHKPIFDLVKEQIRKAIADLADGSFEIFDSYHEQLETFKKNYKWCPYIQINPVIGSDLNVYSCHDKAYNLKNGLIGSIKEQRFSDFWFTNKSKFFKINPAVHCNHHCVVNEKNNLILDYLNADIDHLSFV